MGSNKTLRQRCCGWRVGARLPPGITGTSWLIKNQLIYLGIRSDSISPTVMVQKPFGTRTVCCFPHSSSCLIDHSMLRFLFEQLPRLYFPSLYLDCLGMRPSNPGRFCFVFVPVVSCSSSFCRTWNYVSIVAPPPLLTFSWFQIFTFRVHGTILLRAIKYYRRRKLWFRS